MLILKISNILVILTLCFSHLVENVDHCDFVALRNMLIR